MSTKAEISAPRFDAHTHILPGMDDGARDVAASVGLLEELGRQQVGVAALTPHFYPRRESAESFLARRAAAFETLSAALARRESEKPVPRLLPGAEVYVVRDLCRGDPRPLCIEGTNLLLLELPRTPYKPWISDEISNIVYEWDVVPVLAHLERYRGFYSKKDFEQLLKFDEFVCQFNADSVSAFGTVSFLAELAERGFPLLMGSDCHDLRTRPPRIARAHDRLKGSRKGRAVLSRLYSVL